MSHQANEPSDDDPRQADGVSTVDTLFPPFHSEEMLGIGCVVSVDEQIDVGNNHFDLGFDKTASASISSAI